MGDPLSGKENGLKICARCNKAIKDDGRKHHLKLLCEDCYIDEVMPKMAKSYDNPVEFFQRLKDSYSVIKQRFH